MEPFASGKRGLEPVWSLGSRRSHRHATDFSNNPDLSNLPPSLHQVLAYLSLAGLKPHFRHSVGAARERALAACHFIVLRRSTIHATCYIGDMNHCEIVSSILAEAPHIAQNLRQPAGYWATRRARCPTVRCAGLGPDRTNLQ